MPTGLVRKIPTGEFTKSLQGIQSIPDGRSISPALLLNTEEAEVFYESFYWR